MPVAEVFLGAFLQVLFDRLASPELLKFATREGISSGLDKLKENLRIINQVITLAENMLARDPVVDEWLEELRDWAYDADDFLDKVNTKAMQEAMQAEEEEEEARRNNTSSSISVPSWVSGITSGFNSGDYSENVDQLNGRWDAIYKRMKKTVSGITSSLPTNALHLQLVVAAAQQFPMKCSFYLLVYFFIGLFQKLIVQSFTSGQFLHIVNFLKLASIPGQLHPFSPLLSIWECPPSIPKFVKEKEAQIFPKAQFIYYV